MTTFYGYNVGLVLPDHLKMVARFQEIVVNQLLVLDKAFCAVKCNQKLEAVYTE